MEDEATAMTDTPKYHEGGVLPPATEVIQNRSGQAERIFPAEQAVALGLEYARQRYKDLPTATRWDEPPCT
jgi:hypothetical protein